LPALRPGPVVRAALPEGLLRLRGPDEVRRRLCATKAEGGLDVEGRTQRKLAAPEMGVGPPEPPCRGRLQTTASCAGTTAGVVSVAEKASRGGRQVRAGKANESEPLMTRREAKMMSKPRWSDDPWEKPGG